MDAATMTAFCTTSFQLKFALAGRKPNLAFLQTRLPPIDRRGVELASVVVRSRGLEQRSPGNSAGDDFSGWANGDPKPTLLAGIPAPTVVPSAALHSPPGEVLVPAFVDQYNSQPFYALQYLKVIEDGVQPGDLCTRREYARWLLKANNSLSRNTKSEVFPPAIYIENVTQLSFDDITPEDPDFPYIQGLAEARLIASKLTRHDMQSHDRNSSYFFPDSLLSRQDLVSWKMALEKRLLPTVDKKIVQQLTRFMDIHDVNPDAWPAVVADVAAGDKGIIALAFANTRRFQPAKPVTKAQAAVALSTGDASNWNNICNILKLLKGIVEKAINRCMMIREVAMFASYVKSITGLLKVGIDKWALKVAKRKLGAHKKAKKKT